MVATARPFHCVQLRYNCQEGRNEIFAELRATELLFHLKFNNFNCDLQIFAESEDGNISVDFKIIKA